jgi:hypothetical protein
LYDDVDVGVNVDVDVEHGRATSDDGIQCSPYPRGGYASIQDSYDFHVPIICHPTRVQLVKMQA